MLHPIKFEIGNLEYFITFLSLPTYLTRNRFCRSSSWADSEWAVTTESCGTKDRRKQRRNQDRTDM